MTATVSVSNIKPLAGYVLVEQAAAQKQTASGIYLPDSHEEKSKVGVVVAVGGAAMIDGVKVEPPVKAKDQVIYKKGWDNDLKIGDAEVFLVKFEDIMAVITK